MAPEKWVRGMRQCCLLVAAVCNSSFGAQGNGDLSSPGGSDGKASVYNAGDVGSIPGLGRSPGEENVNPSSTTAWKIPWTEEPGRL